MNKLLVVIITDLPPNIIKSRSYDIALISQKLTNTTEYYLEAQYNNNKMNLISKLFKINPDLITKYEYFWFPDDNIIYDHNSINKMADILEAHNNMAIYQPSLKLENHNEIFQLVYNKNLTELIIHRKGTLDLEEKKNLEEALYKIDYYKTLFNPTNLDIMIPVDYLSLSHIIIPQQILKDNLEYLTYYESNDKYYGFGLEYVLNKYKKFIINGVSFQVTKQSQFLLALTNKAKLNISPTKEARNFLHHYNLINKNLVIIPTGDNTYHDFSKIPQKSRNFDIGLIYYNDTDSEKFRNQCEYFYHKSGPKYKLIKEVLCKQSPNYSIIPWTLYDYIWLPDDDLVISIKKIEELFDIATRNNLDLCQPAVKIPNLDYKQVLKILDLLPDKKLRYTYASLFALRDKYPKQAEEINTILYRVSYPILTRHTNQEMRSVDFIEIQMPLLSRKFLKYFYEILEDPIVQSGFGLDELWSQLIKNKYVIDTIEVEHMRDTGFSKYEKYLKGKLKLEDVPEQYRNLEKNPKNEAEILKKKYANYPVFNSSAR